MAPAGAAVQVPIAAVAVGERSVTRVTKLLETATPVRSPLASAAMDSARLRQLGLLDEEDESMMEFRHVALQLEVIEEGLALEMFGKF